VIVPNFKFEGHCFERFPEPRFAAAELRAPPQCPRDLEVGISLLASLSAGHTGAMAPFFHDEVGASEHATSVLLILLLFLQKLSPLADASFVTWAASCPLTFDHRISIFNCADPTWIDLFRIRRLAYVLCFRSHSCSLWAVWDARKDSYLLSQEFVHFLRADADLDALDIDNLVLLLCTSISHVRQSSAATEVELFALVRARCCVRTSLSRSTARSSWSGSSLRTPWLCSSTPWARSG
jgi:hypothetical protein